MSRVKRPQSKPADRTPSRPPPVYEPVDVTVRLSACQHASLVQIHSVVRRPGDPPMDLDELLQTCLLFAAAWLSLPLPRDPRDDRPATC